MPDSLRFGCSSLSESLTLSGSAERNHNSFYHHDPDPRRRSARHGRNRQAIWARFRLAVVHFPLQTKLFCFLQELQTVAGVKRKQAR